MKICNMSKKPFHCGARMEDGSCYLEIITCNQPTCECQTESVEPKVK